MFRFNKNKPLIMGIINITPDSFSDGGENFSAESAVETVINMQNDGADILDVGAHSTAPKSTPITEAEEIERLKNILPDIIRSAKVPVSIDTVSPKVAEYALSLGVSIVNDESGMFNPEMAKVVKKYDCGWIFMHTGGLTSKESGIYENGIVNEVFDFFGKMKSAAVSFGISPDSLCYDYGIGFGKSRKDDLILINNTDFFVKDFSPLSVGLSRKRIIGEAINEDEPKKRLFGTISANSIAIYKGAGILRVHDVKPCADCIKMCMSIKKGDFYE